MKRAGFQSENVTYSTRKHQITSAYLTYSGGIHHVFWSDILNFRTVMGISYIKDLSMYNVFLGRKSDRKKEKDFLPCYLF